jgi:hypothetical protein
MVASSSSLYICCSSFNTAGYEKLKFWCLISVWTIKEWLTVLFTNRTSHPNNLGHS